MTCHVSSLTVLLLVLVSFSWSCVAIEEEPTITAKAYMDISISGQKVGRLTIGLFGEDVPVTVENFRQLITGEPGFGYKNTIFHYAHPLYYIQGGDVTNAKGRGGYSIYGRTFPDENFKIKHFSGAVAMANRGRDTNNSQFYITSNETPWLDNKNVVFGKLLSGQEIVDLIQGVEKNPKNGRLAEEVKIVDCGILE